MKIIPCAYLMFVLCLTLGTNGAIARDGTLRQTMMERLQSHTLDQENDDSATDSSGDSPKSKQGLYTHGKGQSETVGIGDRDLILYTPPVTNKTNKLPLLVVLHGGMGNADQIKNYIGLEPLADRYGFAIAFMNGTKVAKALTAKRKGWNAGGCCGQPAAEQVDDVAAIQQAVQYLLQSHAIDPNRIYGTGHSNGAMMTYRLLCESNLYRGAVIYAGTLALDVTACPLSRGKPILALHGMKDANVPVQGGHASKGFNSQTDYTSQAATRAVFEKSGALYTQLLLPNADHSPLSINADLIALEKKTLPEKIVSFLGLNSAQK